VLGVRKDALRLFGASRAAGFGWAIQRVEHFLKAAHHALGQGRFETASGEGGVAPAKSGVEARGAFVPATLKRGLQALRVHPARQSFLGDVPSAVVAQVDDEDFVFWSGHGPGGEVLLDVDGILLGEGRQPQVADGGGEANEKRMVERLLREREHGLGARRVCMEDVQRGGLPHRTCFHPRWAAVHRCHRTARNRVAQVDERVERVSVPALRVPRLLSEVLRCEGKCPSSRSP
jgi:hypothetical protein